MVILLYLSHFYINLFSQFILKNQITCLNSIYLD